MKSNEPGAMLFIDVGQMACSGLAREELSIEIPHHYVTALEDGLIHLAHHQPSFVLLSCLTIDDTVAEQCAAIKSASEFVSTNIVLMLPEESIAGANLVLPGVVGFAACSSDWSVVVKQLLLTAGMIARIRELERTARNSRLADDAFGIMRCSIDIESEECTAEPSLLHAFGLAETIAENHPFPWRLLLEALSEQTRSLFATSVERSAATGEDWRIDCRFRGERVDIECCGFVGESFNGKPAEIVLVFRKSKRSVETIDVSVNRKNALGSLKQKIHSSAVGSVLLLRIDNYQGVCKSLGYEAAGHIVSAAMARTASLVRSSDLVLRAQNYEESVIHLGGPEFMIVLDGISAGRVLTEISQRVEGAFRRPFKNHALKVPLRVVIGYSAWPGDADNASDLLSAAARRIEAASASNKRNLAELRAVRDSVQMETDLYEALNRGELELHFQPKFRLDEHRSIVGAEALIRWHRYDSEWIPPDVFIPIAEKNGLITVLGAWVIEEAVRCQARWRDQGLGLLPVSVNVSAEQFLEPDFVTHLSDTCGRADIPRTAIEIEITESCLIEQPESVIAVLNELKSLGFVIALDDFGTGFSSLSYLRTLPLDVLKIDRSFVASLDGDNYDPALTSGIIGIGLALGLRIIAEGIETETQWHLLKEWGCHHGQGYLMSRPLPEKKLAALLEPAGLISGIQ